MLGFQECIRSAVYSRLALGDAGGDDNDLRAEWDLRVAHISTRKESCWVQMGLHCQVQPRWVSNSLKGKISYQKSLTGVWTRLYGYLLIGREGDIRADPSVISSVISLATLSVGH